MKVDIYNSKNEKIDSIELSEKIFGVEWNADLAHQALATQLANRRQILAHAKDRSEVSGGGKKPWRQKGTGRARHGSIRSPLWKGGGVTFGPNKEKIFARKINKKMNRLAILSVLSKKLKDGEIKIIDSFNLADSKTKTASAFLKKIFKAKETKEKTKEKISALLIPASDNKIKKNIVNIKNISAISPFSLNIYDLLKHKNILLEKEAVGEIEKNYK